MATLQRAHGYDLRLVRVQSAPKHWGDPGVPPLYWLDDPDCIALCEDIAALCQELARRQTAVEATHNGALPCATGGSPSSATTLT